MHTIFGRFFLFFLLIELINQSKIEDLIRFVSFRILLKASMDIIDLFPKLNFELFWAVDLSGSIFDCAHQKSLNLVPKLWIKVDKINRKNQF